MGAVLRDFESLAEESTAFFSFLRALGDRDEPAVDAALLAAGVPPSNLGLLRRTFKASAFLVLYNMVEATVRRGMGAIFEAIANEPVALHLLPERIRVLWVREQLMTLVRKNASADTLEPRVLEMLETAARHQTVRLQERDLPISGNIDAEQVRVLLRNVGVPFVAPATTKGGMDLTVVVRRRNELAHGESSFVTCGGNYTVSDLLGMHDRVTVFLRGVVAAIESYVAAKQYTCDFVLRSVRGISAEQVQKLCDHFGDAARALRASPDDLESLGLTTDIVDGVVNAHRATLTESNFRRSSPLNRGGS